MVTETRAGIRAPADDAGFDVPHAFSIERIKRTIADCLAVRESLGAAQETERPRCYRGLIAWRDFEFRRTAARRSFSLKRQFHVTDFGGFGGVAGLG